VGKIKKKKTKREGSPDGCVVNTYKWTGVDRSEGLSCRRGLTDVAAWVKEKARGWR